MKMVSVYVAQNKGCAVAVGWKACIFYTLALDIITTQTEATYTKQCLYLMHAEEDYFSRATLLRQMRTAGYFICSSYNVRS